MVGVDHACGVDLAGGESTGRLSFTADMVAVQTDADIESAHVDVEAVEKGEREQRALGGVDGTDSDPLAGEVGPIGDRGVVAHRDDRREVAVGVAHDQRLCLRHETPAADPRQRRVPRHVDATAGEVFDLALVVRIQDVVERQSLLGEPTPEALPDRHHLGVVGDGAEDQRVAHRSGSPLMARPTKSKRASVVGAITRAARASRNRRSTPSSLRNAAPPHTFMARSVTEMAASPAAALTSRTRSVASSRSDPSAVSVSPRKAAAWSVVIRMRAWSVRTKGCSASVWPRCSSVVPRMWAPASSVTASIRPMLNAALMTRNHGSASASAMSRPAPSSPSMAARGTLTPDARIGFDALPRRPSPSKSPATVNPLASEPTSHSVIGPPFSSGLLDHT